MAKFPLFGLIPILVLAACTQQQTRLPWVADLGDGRYQNPILFADYSDPDVVRVADDYYMVASSFNSSPGLPILHSKDLVNWRLVNHVIQRQVPVGIYATPQHGNGVWAPCIRYQNGKYWVFYPDPDYGIYMSNTANPLGEWSEPVLMLPGQGIIDPSPLWDDDGNAYLIHAWAQSRAGFNNVLTLHRMTPDGTRVLDEGKIIIDGNQIPNYNTLEGPKLYKHGGYYYVFAPAGGVEQGWQSVFRANKITGPYQDRIVLSQGNTDINGPHQGAWVVTHTGESWFFHFQSRGPFGRVVHLQPMTWLDGWPVIGSDEDDDGVGEPVAVFHKPNVGSGDQALSTPAASDDFLSPDLGLQWQWNANWQMGWYSLRDKTGSMRLFAQHNPSTQNLWAAPFLLMQKLPAPKFEVTAKITFRDIRDEDRGGLLIYGYDYAWLGVRNHNGTDELVYTTCEHAMEGCEENVRVIAPLEKLSSIIELKAIVIEGEPLHFAYALDGQDFIVLPDTFFAKPGRWVGAKMGLFMAAGSEGSPAFMDVDSFLVQEVF